MVSAFLIVVGCLLGGMAAGAAPITFSFAGNVTGVHSDPYLSLAFTGSESISGTYTFDPSVPPHDQYPSYGGGTVGNYSLTVANFNIGSHSFVANTSPGEPNGSPLGINVADDVVGYSSVPPYDLYSLNLSAFGGGVSEFKFALQPEHFLWALTDPTASALSSSDLPLTPPLLGDFSGSEWSLSFLIYDPSLLSPSPYIGHGYLTGTITTLALVQPDHTDPGSDHAVPDSTGIESFCLAGTWLALAARWRKKLPPTLAQRVLGAEEAKKGVGLSRKCAVERCHRLGSDWD
jgi:hypothetical protein